MKKFFIASISFLVLFIVSCATTVPKQTVSTPPVPEEPAAITNDIVTNNIVGGFILPAGVTLRESERGSLMLFSTNALFAFASSDLPDSSFDIFSAVEFFLANNTNVNLVFETHTGNIGEAQANYRLSVSRMSNAIAYMKTMEGMQLERIEPIALGEALPEYEDQRKLRRYEFVIIRNQADRDKYYNFVKTLDVKKESDGTIVTNK